MSTFGVVAFLAVLAELAGHDHHPFIDLSAGLAIALLGTLTWRFPHGRFTGALLLAAAAHWFLLTAGRAAGLAGQYAAHWTFLHRGLLTHALLIATFDRGTDASIHRAWTSSRAIRWTAVAFCYFASINRGRGLSTPWVLSVGVSVIIVLILDLAARRRTVGFAVAAALGTATWACAASALRTSGWASASTSFTLYCLGMVTIAAVVAESTRRAMSESEMRAGDIVRDGGRGDVRVGFQRVGTERFDDIRGEPFIPEAGESTARIGLGADLGDVMLARRTAVVDARAIDQQRLQRNVADGLRLLAVHHRALEATRVQAAEVAASERRIRAADERASDGLGLELHRMVVGRVLHAIDVLSDDSSDVGEQARQSLLEVLDEVKGLAAGMAPKSLDAGLTSALTSLADQESVPVTLDVAPIAMDPRVAQTVYFTVAECITNAVRHASPTSIDVVLVGTAGELVLTVADDGCGGASIPSGGGLAGLRSRVELHGGTLAVGTKGEGGTVITVRLPLNIDTSRFS